VKGIDLQAGQMTLDGITRALAEEGSVELRNFGVFAAGLPAPRGARGQAEGPGPSRAEDHRQPARPLPWCRVMDAARPG
jgi:hypothetical protein